MGPRPFAIGESFVYNLFFEKLNSVLTPAILSYLWMSRKTSFHGNGRKTSKRTLEVEKVVLDLTPWGLMDKVSVIVSSSKVKVHGLNKGVLTKKKTVTFQGHKGVPLRSRETGSYSKSRLKLRVDLECKTVDVVLSEKEASSGLLRTHVGIKGDVHECFIHPFETVTVYSRILSTFAFLSLPISLQEDSSLHVECSLRISSYVLRVLHSPHYVKTLDIRGCKNLSLLTLKEGIKTLDIRETELSRLVLPDGIEKVWCDRSALNYLRKVNLPDSLAPNSCLVELFHDLEEFEWMDYMIGPSNTKAVALLGKGAFGEVFRYRVNVPSAVIEPEIVIKTASVKNGLRKEVRFFRAFDHKHPNISLPIFFNSKVLIFESLRGYDELTHHIQCASSPIDDVSRSQSEIVRDGKHETLVSHPDYPLWAIKVVLNILTGIEHLHSHTIAHRDIKPNNIIVKDSHAIIIDFGLSMLPGDKEKITGTMKYMAPEFFKSGEVRKGTFPTDFFFAGDIYSTGLILSFLFKTEHSLPDEGYLIFSREYRKGIVWPSEKYRLGVESLLSELLKEEPSKRITASKACVYIRDHLL